MSSRAPIKGNNAPFVASGAVFYAPPRKIRSRYKPLFRKVLLTHVKKGVGVIPPPQRRSIRSPRVDGGPPPLSGLPVVE